MSDTVLQRLSSPSEICLQSVIKNSQESTLNKIMYRNPPQWLRKEIASLPFQNELKIIDLKKIVPSGASLGVLREILFRAFISSSEMPMYFNLLKVFLVYGGLCRISIPSSSSSQLQADYEKERKKICLLSLSSNCKVILLYFTF